jgi:GMP synthase (glutamine-hydrolysing)
VNPLLTRERYGSSAMHVLSIVHEPGDTGGGGLFETTVERRGDTLVRWVIPDGAAPGRPTDFDAVLVFGGAMHPDQDAEHPWLPQEAAYLEETLAADVPLLGVCLGSQMIARAAGGVIGPAAAAEVGWHDVELTDDGRSDPVLGMLPSPFEAFQWHYYAWELPPGGVLLATNDAAPQAYRVGERVWGVQFHPEVTRRMLDAWFAHGEAELPKPREQLSRETDERLGPWNTQGRALCEAFLDTAARG